MALSAHGLAEDNEVKLQVKLCVAVRSEIYRLRLNLDEGPGRIHSCFTDDYLSMRIHKEHHELHVLTRSFYSLITSLSLVWIHLSTVSILGGSAFMCRLYLSMDRGSGKNTKLMYHLCLSMGSGSGESMRLNSCIIWWRPQWISETSNLCSNIGVHTRN
jgi:hypothetical protein